MSKLSYHTYKDLWCIPEKLSNVTSRVHYFSEPCSNKISTAKISAGLEERDVLQTNALMEWRVYLL